MEATHRTQLELMMVMGATLVCAAVVTFAPVIGEAQAQSAPRLQSVQDFVQPLWDLEKRAIASGQRGAGILFTGLATIHLTIVGLQSLFRGSDLQGGVGAFVEQLFWATLFGASIAMGPTWALAIVEFFRDVGRGIATGQNRPQILLDLAIQFFSNANGGVIGLIGSSLGGVLVTAIIMILAGLINLVTLAVECEVHFVIAAGTVVLGFGGAAFTRSLMSAFWYYTVSAGIRAMLVEMIDGATMQVLIEATKEAQRTGSTEAAATLAAGLLVVCGFLLAAPIVAHVLISSSIRTGADAAASALPRAAIAGGISGMGTAALKGLGGAMGGLAGGRGKASGSPQGGTDGASASQGGPSAKRPNDGGAAPSSSALNASAASGAQAKSPGVATERGRTAAGGVQASTEGAAQGGSDANEAGRDSESLGEATDASSSGSTAARAVTSAPLPASWQGGLGSRASTPASQGTKPEHDAKGAPRAAGSQGGAEGSKKEAAPGSPSMATSASSGAAMPPARSAQKSASLAARLGPPADNLGGAGEGAPPSRAPESSSSAANTAAGSSNAGGSSAAAEAPSVAGSSPKGSSAAPPSAASGTARATSNRSPSGASEGSGGSQSPSGPGPGVSPLPSSRGTAAASNARPASGGGPSLGGSEALSAVATGPGPRGRTNAGGAAPGRPSAPASGDAQATTGAGLAPSSSLPSTPLRPASSQTSRGARTMRVADEPRGTASAKNERLSVRSVIGDQGKGERS